MLPFDDDYFMRLAIQEAQKAFDKGEVPVGAIAVCQGQIIAKTHNCTENLRDVTAHAEILAITAAADWLGAKYLNECTLYVTLEPCTMCAGALAWAQLGRLAFGASDKKRGFMRHSQHILHPQTTVQAGIQAPLCSALLKAFFSSKR